MAKIKEETRGLAIEEFVGLKPKMYSFFVDNSECKKAKDVNRNVTATISHKVELLNNKRLRHSINRILSKEHRMGACKINKISLPCFDDKTYIKDNGYDGLALGYYS